MGAGKTRHEGRSVCGPAKVEKVDLTSGYNPVALVCFSVSPCCLQAVTTSQIDGEDDPLGKLSPLYDDVAGTVSADLTSFNARMQVRDTPLSFGSFVRDLGFGLRRDTGLTIPTPVNGQIVLGPLIPARQFGYYRKGVPPRLRPVHFQRSGACLSTLLRHLPRSANRDRCTMITPATITVAETGPQAVTITSFGDSGGGTVSLTQITNGTGSATGTVAVSTQGAITLIPGLGQNTTITGTVVAGAVTTSGLTTTTITSAGGMTITPGSGALNIFATSLSLFGTIVDGTWQADPIAMTYGGTGSGVTALTPGNTVNVNWTLTPYHKLTIDRNTTFTFSNDSVGNTIRVYVTQSPSGWDITWPTGVANFFKNANASPDPGSGETTEFLIYKLG